MPRVIERHRSAVIAGAAIAPLVTCAVLSAFRESLPAATNVLILVLVVIAAASTGVRAAGIVAAVSAGVWFDFFLTQPYGQLAINDPDEVEAAVLLVVIGAAVTEVALWGHRQQARANRRAGYLDGVLGTAEIVTLSTESPDALTAHVAEQIKQVLAVSRCRFVLGPVRDPRIPVLGHEGDVTRLGKDHRRRPGRPADRRRHRSRGHPLGYDRGPLPAHLRLARRTSDTRAAQGRRPACRPGRPGPGRAEVATRSGLRQRQRTVAQDERGGPSVGRTRRQPGACRERGADGAVAADQRDRVGIVESHVGRRRPRPRAARSRCRRSSASPARRT